MDGNKTLRITASGLEDGPYVQSVTVNGQAWSKNWVTHADLIAGDGGRIHFELGSSQTEWDTDELPPSPGHLDLGIKN